MGELTHIMSPALVANIERALFGCARPGAWDEWRRWCEVWSVRVEAPQIDAPRPGGNRAVLPNVAGLIPLRNEAGEGTKPRPSVRHRMRQSIVQESLSVEAPDPLRPMPLAQADREAFAAQARAASQMAGAAMRGRAP